MARPRGTGALAVTRAECIAQYKVVMQWSAALAKAKRDPRPSQTAISEYAQGLRDHRNELKRLENIHLGYADDNS